VYLSKRYRSDGDQDSDDRFNHVAAGDAERSHAQAL
jgi:hypothetical protein